jgi:hypothetical protein
MSTTAELEERVRHALRSRAEQVTYADLRPAEPPSQAAGAERRVRWLTLSFGLAVVAAAVVAVVVFLAGPVHETPRPDLPAGPGPVPSPSRSAPSRSAPSEASPASRQPADARPGPSVATSEPTRAASEPN